MWTDRSEKRPTLRTCCSKRCTGKTLNTGRPYFLVDANGPFILVLRQGSGIECVVSRAVKYVARLGVGKLGIGCQILLNQTLRNLVSRGRDR